MARFEHWPIRMDGDREQGWSRALRDPLLCQESALSLVGCEEVQQLLGGEATVAEGTQGEWGRVGADASVTCCWEVPCVKYRNPMCRTVSR